MDIAKLMANEHPENLPLSNGLNIPASGVEKPSYLALEVALEQSVIITMVGTCCDPSAFCSFRAGGKRRLSQQCFHLDHSVQSLLRLKLRQ